MKLNLLKLIGSLLPKPVSASRQTEAGPDFQAVFKDAATAAPQIQQSTSSAVKMPPADKPAVSFATRYSEQHVQADNKLPNSSKLPSAAAKKNSTTVDLRQPAKARVDLPCVLSTAASLESDSVDSLGKLGKPADTAASDATHVTASPMGENAKKTEAVSILPVNRTRAARTERPADGVRGTLTAVTNVVPVFRRPDESQVPVVLAETPASTIREVVHAQPRVSGSRTSRQVTPQEIPRQQASTDEEGRVFTSGLTQRENGAPEARSRRRSEQLAPVANLLREDVVQERSTSDHRLENSRTKIVESGIQRAAQQTAHSPADTNNHVNVTSDMKPSQHESEVPKEGVKVYTPVREVIRESHTTNANAVKPSLSNSTQNLQQAGVPNVVPQNEPKGTSENLQQGTPARGATERPNRATRTDHASYPNRTRNRSQHVELTEVFGLSNNSEITQASTTVKSPTQEPAVRREGTSQLNRPVMTARAESVTATNGYNTGKTNQVPDTDAPVRSKRPIVDPGIKSMPSAVTNKAATVRSDSNNRFSKTGTEVPTSHIPQREAESLSVPQVNGSKDAREPKGTLLKSAPPSETYSAPQRQVDNTHVTASNNIASVPVKRSAEGDNLPTRGVKASVSDATGLRKQQRVLATGASEGQTSVSTKVTPETRSNSGRPDTDQVRRVSAQANHVGHLDGAKLTANEVPHGTPKAQSADTADQPSVVQADPAPAKSGAELNRSTTPSKLSDPQAQRLMNVQTPSGNGPRITAKPEAPIVRSVHSTVPRQDRAEISQQQTGGQAASGFMHAVSATSEKNASTPGVPKETARSASAELQTSWSHNNAPTDAPKNDIARKVITAVPTQIRPNPEEKPERPVHKLVATEKSPDGVSNENLSARNKTPETPRANTVAESTLQNVTPTGKPFARAERLNDSISRGNAYLPIEHTAPSKPATPESATERTQQPPISETSVSNVQVENSAGLPTPKPVASNSQRPDSKAQATDLVLATDRKPIAEGAITSGRTGQDAAKQATTEPKPHEPARKTNELGTATQKESETVSVFRADNTQAKPPAEPNAQQTTANSASQRNIEGNFETVLQRGEVLPRPVQPEAMKAALQQALEMSRKRLVEPDELRLSMPFGELGTLDIDVARQSETYSIHIAAEPSVAAVLEESKVALLSWMREQGYAVERLDLSVRVDLQSQSSNGGDHRPAHGADKQSSVGAGTNSSLRAGEESGAQAAARPAHSGAHVWTA